VFGEVLLSKAKRFAATGVAATGVHVLIAFVSIQFGGVHPALANALASVGATLFSYVLHTLWSFSEAMQIRNFSRFLVVSLGSCVLAAAIAAAAEAWGLSYWVGIALVACIIPMLSFSAHYLWTYRT
jgi:putative flippase GtrA